MIDKYRVKQFVRDRRAYAVPGSVAWIMHCLYVGPYADGGYPTFYVTADGGVLSHAAVLENLLQICRAARSDARWDSQWRLEAFGINWEDPELFCDHTGQRIESAYADND